MSFYPIDLYMLVKIYSMTLTGLLFVNKFLKNLLNQAGDGMRFSFLFIFMVADH